MKDTDYNKVVPAIISTNIFCVFTEHRFDTDIPEAWLTAIDGLCDSVVPVKSTNNFTIRVGPGEMKTVNGVARHSGNLKAGLTEHINNSLSGDMTICPRVIAVSS